MLASQGNGQEYGYQFPQYTGEEMEFQLLSSYLFDDSEEMNHPVSGDMPATKSSEPFNYGKKELSKMFAVVEQGKDKRAKTARGAGRITRPVSVDSGLNEIEDDEDDVDDEDEDDDGEDGDVGEDGQDGEVGQDGKTHRKKRLRERQDQVARRRERNRVLARKTRLRKKFFFESLQQQAAQLTSENEVLKEIVRKKLEGRMQTQLLASTSESTASVLADGNAAAEPTAVLNRKDFSLLAAIQTAQRSFVITDPSLPDNPIIFASKGFLDLTGYPLDKVLGRNCRFMQVAGTDPAQHKILREGIEKGVDTSVCMLNAKADGTLFYNHIFVAALRDANSNIVNYVGVQLEVLTVTRPDNAGDEVSQDAAYKVESKSRARRKPEKECAQGASAASAAQGREQRLARRQAPAQSLTASSSSVEPQNEGSERGEEEAEVGPEI